MSELPVLEGESPAVVVCHEQRREHGSGAGWRRMRYGRLRQRGLRVPE
ncbi:MAG TPA: hypothetical protein VEX68_18255 [Bryobacteraceae bacterium]|nr:hypothetical protein [Bryobacteraceae bacterium]